MGPPQDGCGSPAAVPAIWSTRTSAKSLFAQVWIQSYVCIYVYIYISLSTYIYIYMYLLYDFYMDISISIFGCKVYIYINTYTNIFGCAFYMHVDGRAGEVSVARES